MFAKSDFHLIYIKSATDCCCIINEQSSSERWNVMVYKVLSTVLAGGVGTRLQPLTLTRAKPALAFGKHHRIIDFVMSNLYHSGLQQIMVLTQYKAHSLHQYLRHYWQPRLRPDGLLQLCQAPEDVAQGTAGAVASRLDVIRDYQPDAIAILSADHVYKMDYSQMVACHRQQQADITVAAIALPVDKARQFGVFTVDKQNNIVDFVEKPQHTVAEMPQRPGYALVSMGNYIFSADCLYQALQHIKPGHSVDFGHDILPGLFTTVRARVYDFSLNELPGDQSLPHYWRDVGTLNSYFQTRLDMLCHTDWLAGASQQWPILGHCCDAHQGAALTPGQMTDKIVSACISTVRRLAPAKNHYPLYC
jgi:glucose-1-phosphate adenylyltransferase